MLVEEVGAILIVTLAKAFMLMGIESADGGINSGTINEIVNWLKERKDTDRPVVCFLGSRAGGFYNNHKLFSSLSNHGLALIEEKVYFQKSYHILSRLDGALRYQLLSNSLNDMQALKVGGDYLNQLIKEGFINAVITTNVDSYLEDEMKRDGFDSSHLLVYGRQSTDEIRNASEKGAILFKIFGDLKEEKGCKTAGNEFDVRDDKNLRKYLEGLLRQDILFIGFDREWDGSIDWVVPTHGRDIYYVNDMPPSPDMLLFRAFNRRNGRFFQTQFGGDSTPVLQNIFEAYKNAPANPTKLASVDNSGKDFSRNLIFISYSHKDATFKDRLNLFLNITCDKTLVKSWDDSNIKVGGEWDKEIQKALQATKAAILLVSIDFLNSKYIQEHELPPIIRGVEAQEVRLIQVVLGFCDFNNQKLSKYHTVNSPSTPMARLSQVDQDEIWQKVSKEIRALMNSG